MEIKQFVFLCISLTIGICIGTYWSEFFYSNFLSSNNLIDNKICLTSQQLQSLSSGPKIGEVHEINESKNIEKPKKLLANQLFEQPCKNKAPTYEKFQANILAIKSMYEKVLDSNEKLDLKGWGSIDVFLNDFMENFTNIPGRNSIRIIEVGSYKGLSTVSLGKTCKKLQELYKKSCTVIAVDTWLGTSEHYEVPKWFNDFSKKDLFLTFLNNVKLENLSDIIFPLRLPSQTAAHLLHCYKIDADWIFIDADHDYEPVLSDIRRFYPLIHRGGILFGHDYNWNGVKKAVNEFVEMKKDGIKFWISDVYWFIRKDFEDIEFFG